MSDQPRLVVLTESELEAVIERAVLKALNGGHNGNGHTTNSPETDEGERQHVRILAAAKIAVEAGALLTAEQLAVMLQVHKATIYEQVKKKTIPYHQAGRFVRFNLQEVLAAQRKKGEKTP